jgi:hypothetical protein
LYPKADDPSLASYVSPSSGIASNAELICKPPQKRRITAGFNPGALRCLISASRMGVDRRRVGIV